MYYEVNLTGMGFMKSDPKSMTADETEWNNPDKPDAWNVWITETDDDGEIEIISDIDFPQNAKQYAESNYHMMQLLIDFAAAHDVPFGSVPNPHV